MRYLPSRAALVRGGGDARDDHKYLQLKLIDIEGGVQFRPKYTSLPPLPGEVTLKRVHSMMGIRRGKVDSLKLGSL